MKTGIGATTGGVTNNERFNDSSLDRCGIHFIVGLHSASDIIRKTQIKLPKQLVTSIGNKNPNPNKPLVLRIMVQHTRVLTVDDFNYIIANLQSVGKKAKKEKDKFTQRMVSEQYVNYFSKAGAEKNAVNTEIRDLQALEEYILAQRTTLIPGQKMIVVIIPHPESMLQGIVNIFDICQRHKIEYHFKYPDADKRKAEFERWKNST